MANLNKNFKLKPLYLWKPSALSILLIIVLLSISYLIYNNYTVEQAHKLEQMRNEETNLKDDLALKYKQVKNLSLYIKKTEELNQLESQISAHFPASEELSQILIQINQLAEDTNVYINSFSPKDGQETAFSGNNGQRILSQTYALAITASYASLVEFIYQIAKLQRVVNVIGLHITRADDDKINATFDIKIFYSNK